MKNPFIFLLGGLGLLLGACDKQTVDAPNFSVTTAKTEYKVGEAVQFDFAGSNPDLLSFYSGEGGANYDFRTRTTADGTPQVVFSTYLQNPGQANTLRLLASTNFAGPATPASVAAATWTDITARATLSTGTDNTASGTVNLTDFLAADQPVTFAFRYLAVPATSAATRQPKWTIRTFTVSNVVENSYVAPISTIDQLGWVAVDVQNSAANWTVPANGQAVIDGPASTVTPQPTTEDWLVSKPLNLRQVTPNIGASIKNANGNRLATYTYIYRAAGTYTATFVGTNNTVDDNKDQVQQVQLTIVP